MSIRTDSYSSATGVFAFVRHLADGAAAFNSTTRPALVEVETMIDEVSAELNLALACEGLATPMTNTTAKAACDGWVRKKVVALVEMTAQGLSGWGSLEGERPAEFLSIAGDAANFAAKRARGFKRLGVAVAHPAGEGLRFTGEDAADERDDLDDEDLRQPRFRRGMFGDE